MLRRSLSIKTKCPLKSPSLGLYMSLKKQCDLFKSKERLWYKSSVHEYLTLLLNYEIFKVLQLIWQKLVRCIYRSSKSLCSSRDTLIRKITKHRPIIEDLFTNGTLCSLRNKKEDGKKHAYIVFSNTFNKLFLKLYFIKDGNKPYLMTGISVRVPFLCSKSMCFEIVYIFSF